MYPPASERPYAPWIAAFGNACCTRCSVSGGATSWTRRMRDVSSEPKSGWSTRASVTGGNVDLSTVAPHAPICASAGPAAKCVIEWKRAPRSST